MNGRRRKDGTLTLRELRKHNHSFGCEHRSAEEKAFQNDCEECQDRIKNCPQCQSVLSELRALDQGG